MSVRINKQTDPEEAARNCIPPLRESTLRERQLKEYLTNRGLTEEAEIRCSPEVETAKIRQDTYEETPTIIIPTDIFGAVDGVEEKVAARLGQYGMGLHETGHDLYTDLPYLRSQFERREFNQIYEDLYWDLLNALSDHRIEQALIRDEGEAARKRLDWTNYHLIRVPIAECPVKYRHNISWDVALHAAAIHFGKAREQFEFISALEDATDSRVQFLGPDDEEFYYEVRPHLRDALDDVAEEPDPKAAGDRALKFVSWLDSQLQDQESDLPEPDDEGRETHSSDSRLDSENIGGAKERADALGSESNTSEPPEDSEAAEATTGGSDNDEGDNGPQQIKGNSEAPVSTAGDTTGEVDEEEEQEEDRSEGPEATSDGNTSGDDPGEGRSEGTLETGGEGKSEDPESQGSPVSQESYAGAEQDEAATDADGDCSEETAGQSTSEELVEKEQARVAAEQKRLEAERKRLIAEFERLTQAVSGGAGDATELVVPDTGGEPDSGTWGRIKTLAQSISFDSLATNQTGEYQRGIQSGKLDPTRAAKMVTGTLRVCRRERVESSKDYAVVLVLDRSGSMRSVIEDAEVAIGGLALALEKAGIETCIIELWRNETRLVKPFGRSVATSRRELTSHRASGGTPLTDTLKIARERVLQQPSTPFMIVVGDGKPADESAYTTELDRTPIPVYGVTIGEKDHSRFFTTHRNADPETIEPTLLDLAEKGLS